MRAMTLHWSTPFMIWGSSLRMVSTAAPLRAMLLLRRAAHSGMVSKTSCGALS